MLFWLLQRKNEDPPESRLESPSFTSSELCLFFINAVEISLIMFSKPFANLIPVPKQYH